MPLWMMQAVLIVAPLLLGISITAYWRLRRMIQDSPKPIVLFLQKRWNVLLIVTGGLVLFRGAAISYGVGFVAQVFGFLLSLEFFYLAYVNICVMMSARGVLMGMRFVPWQHFSGYEWINERDVMLTSHRRRYRFRIPAQVKSEVEEVLDLNILK
ncbi:MAG: hypothetical protein HOE48_02690 [Candidatus Latescibacteria bacterium]|jgi:hypothetical protein|nr:hypothetical protein [Candidatus Latescibacterota bacterium]MBT4136790.1 hypothetical protein [Candidatus Latescibacterota bacterium]MBT5832705.1 hypothetical protein [Candidatus Latescibacterota bacterium]